MPSIYIRRINSKGQVTIPAEIRRHLGLRPGDKVIIRVRGGHIEMARATRISG